MNESTVAQQLAMAAIDKAKESISNQMEVTSEASTVTKLFSSDRVKQFESGPLKNEKIEEEEEEEAHKEKEYEEESFEEGQGGEEINN